MTLTDSPHARHTFLLRVRNMKLVIQDLQLEISVAMAAQPYFDAMRWLAEADYHLEIATKELDQTSHRIERL